MSRRGATNGSAEIKRVPLLRVTSAVRACGGAAAGTTCRCQGHTCRSLPARCLRPVWQTDCAMQAMDSVTGDVLSARWHWQHPVLL